MKTNEYYTVYCIGCRKLEPNIVIYLGLFDKLMIRVFRDWVHIKTSKCTFRHPFEDARELKKIINYLQVKLGNKWS